MFDTRLISALRKHNNISKCLRFLYSSPAPCLNAQQQQHIIIIIIYRGYNRLRLTIERFFYSYTFQLQTKSTL